MNNYPTFNVDEIPSIIEDFKGLLGIKIIMEDKQHFLYNYFEEYEKGIANVILYKFNEKVRELASYAQYVLTFRHDWSCPEVYLYLRTKLMDPNLVKETIFEFRAAYHYKYQHKEVVWLPNIGSDSELDLKVVTSSGKTVMVECTRKTEKGHRLSNFKVFQRDIIKALNDKSKQLNKSFLPTMVSIFIPEHFDWYDLKQLPLLSDKIMKKFMNLEYKNISGITIVSARLPKVKLINETTEYTDFDSNVFSMVNEFASYQLPKDFYYGIDQSQEGK